MSDFIERLQVEQKELNEKIGKLIKFLEKPVRIKDNTQNTLLWLQLGHMKHYASCLNLRIANLKEVGQACE